MNTCPRTWQEGWKQLAPAMNRRRRDLRPASSPHRCRPRLLPDAARARSRPLDHRRFMATREQSFVLSPMLRSNVDPAQPTGVSVAGVVSVAGGGGSDGGGVVSDGGGVVSDGGGVVSDGGGVVSDGGGVVSDGGGVVSDGGGVVSDGGGVVSDGGGVVSVGGVVSDGGGVVSDGGGVVSD